MIRLTKRIFKCKVQIIFLLLSAFLINIVVHSIQLLVPVDIETTIIEITLTTTTPTTSTTIKTTSTKEENENVFETEFQQIEQLKTYPNVLDCHYNYSSSILNNDDSSNYNNEAPRKLHGVRIVRGLVIFYPADKNEYFEQEFRWVYRSWVEMRKYEPKLWRTDLVVFMNTKVYAKTNNNVFPELNCTVDNIRKSKNDEPMCTIRNYVEIKDREIPFYNKDTIEQISADEIYSFLYKKINIFNDDAENLWKFYGKLKELYKYQYVDSILMAFDGYSYFKDNFDFLLRTDMDIFITPLFAKWLPLNCNDFVTGSGGYSHDFNMKRLRKAGKLMGLKFSEVRNLGSTWYSTPIQFRYVSYLTLVSMAYLNSEEFSEPERNEKVCTNKILYLWQLKNT